MIDNENYNNKPSEEVELHKVKMIIAALVVFEQGILSSGQAAQLVGITKKTILEESEITEFQYLERQQRILKRLGTLNYKRI